MSLINCSRRPSKKCAVRGCKEPPVFEWQLCACGDFRLCDRHDVEMNEVLIRKLDKRPIAKIMQRYREHERRLDIVRKAATP